MRFGIRFTRFSLLVLTLMLLLPVTTVMAADKANPGVLPPNSQAFGKTYAEWNNAWWQWAYSLPVPIDHPEQHPLFDPTGANCGVGQSGHVWFLGGTFTGDSATRSCTVPPGTALFFPIIDTEMDNLLAPPVYTVDQLRQQLEDFINTVTQLSASIDGRTLENLWQYRVESTDPFAITFPNNNFGQYLGYDIPAGTYYPLVGGGYYLLLPPLSVGTHTIHFSASTSFGGSQNLTYIITVKK